ncbi:hypothetical protein ACTFIZ_003633 [Dictyostelium cf. discoideum]
MTLIISVPSIDKTINFPFKNEITIHELINQILKTVNLENINNNNNFKLLYENSELFENDTIGDLSIPDNSKLILFNQSELIPTATATTTTTTTSTATSTTTSTNSIDLNTKLNKIEISNSNELLIKQIDMIVLDVSCSMAGVAYDGSSKPGFIEMNRSEVSQAFFQTMLDKYVSFEVPVVAGLVLFGQKIDTAFEISRNFDSFSQELGEVVANQGSTRLYEAIYHAATEIVNYRNNPKVKLAPDVCCRIFLLTDGQDTSNINPYNVYQYLKPLNIILDAIPIGRVDNGTLSTLTKATGGSCFMANSTQEGVELFEREALLIPTQRDGFSPFSSPIENEQQFSSLKGDLLKTISRKVDNALKGVTCVSTIDQQKLDEISNNINNGNIIGGGGGGSSSSSSRSIGANKRIYKEYIGFQKSIEESNKNGKSSIFSLYANPNDISIWKVIMKGTVDTPYEGGHFVLSVQFPNNYPFVPPKVRFENRIYHCNINTDGNVCLDILKDQWSAAITSEKVLLSIHSLLSNPNPMDPLDVVKAGIYRDNITEYNSQCKKWVQDYASSLEDLLKEHDLI